VLFEWEHLKKELACRDPVWHVKVSIIDMPDMHPLFETVDGKIELCEKN
jgi:hypothetical protein